MPASVSQLTNLHSLLGSGKTIQYANTFITTPNTTNYNALIVEVFQFLNNTVTAMPELDGSIRIQMVFADGVTIFDTSKSPEVHVLSNVGLGVTSGSTLSWPIGENQNTRGYNMGASLSQSGVFVQEKRSNTTGTDQLYMAVRLGTLNNPLGNIIISLLV